MFYNGDKRTPLNFILYCGWSVQVAIMTINFFKEGLDRLESIFFRTLHHQNLVSIIEKFWMLDIF